jgi:hypothetical protein
MSNNIRFGTWETNEEVLPSVEALGFGFLAPCALSLFISTIETGVLISDLSALSGSNGLRDYGPM